MRDGDGGTREDYGRRIRAREKEKWKKGETRMKDVTGYYVARAEAGYKE